MFYTGCHGLSELTRRLETSFFKVENPGNSPNLRFGVLIFSIFSAKFGLRGLNLGPFFGPLKERFPLAIIRSKSPKIFAPAARQISEPGF
mgnify:CR=1 FL=1